MLPGSNRGAGGNVGFPDVCNTPAGPATVPIPYPNFAFNAMAFPFCFIVRLSFVNALNMGSSIPMTSGDEGGVAHPMFKQAGRYSLGNVKIFFEKLPAIMMGCLTTGNNCNNPIGGVLIPSVTNVFLSDASCVSVLLEQPDAQQPGWRAAAVPTKGLQSLVRDDTQSSRTMVAPGVGYVRVAQLSMATPARVVRWIDELVDAGARALVLDLRDNPGGELDAARRLAEEFLPRGAVITRTQDPDGDERCHTSRHTGNTQLPLWLLVNSGTASAAEVLVAALAWNGRARVLGEPTFGKGRAQVARHTVIGTLYADALVCRLPDGSPLDGHGVQPHRGVASEHALGVAVVEASRDV